MVCGAFSFFFFNDTATPEIYTLSLHDALPISVEALTRYLTARRTKSARELAERAVVIIDPPNLRRSEEHTSELQSHSDLVCRLLLEKKKKKAETLLEAVIFEKLQQQPFGQPIM